MNLGFRRVCIALLLLAGSALGAEPGEIYVVPLHGEVTDAQFFFLRRAIKEAESSHATALVIDMDTYGGELDAATKMLDALFKSSVPTLTYIDTNAGSAGALIALATKRIYMAPVSAIGAAAPVSATGENLSSTMNDKVVSYFSGYFRSAASRNGYNPDIAEAFINKEKEVKIGGTVVHPSGTLLTLGALEACKIIGGKPLLASGTAESLAELPAKAGLQGSLHEVSPLGFERIAFWVTTFSSLFLLIGIVGAYLEIKLHGTLIPGIIAAIAFLIFFAGHYVAGLAGWEVVAVFIIGVALLLSELIIHPGTILPGLAGLVLIIGSLLWAMIDRYPEQPFLPTEQMLQIPARNLSIAIVLSFIVIAILGRYLPETRLYKRMVLSTTSSPGPSFSPDTVSSPDKVRPGAEGIAKTILRPSGKAEFGGDLVIDVITRGEFITAETPIHVISVEGSRIVVEAAG